MAQMAVSRPKSRRWLQLSMAKEEALEGYLLVMPIILGLLIFTLGPILASLYLSFNSWDLFGPPQWNGLGNYSRLLSDDLFIKALRNTLFYTVFAVPIGTGLALSVALVLNRGFKGTTFFRTVYFLPSVCSEVAIAVVWVWLYMPEIGLFDIGLRALGIHSPHWLSSSKWAMPSVIIMAIWGGLGYNMVIFLAGLQSIAQEYYEAAMIDGANRWQSFWSVTMPLLSPITFFVIIMYVIGALQVFASVYIMTSGGPNNATLTIAYYLFRNGFEWFKMGYASALAYVLFFMILMLTGLQWLFQRRWVYYES
jgi:multiple sugar transport system permease protein